MVNLGLTPRSASQIRQSASQYRLNDRWCEAVQLGGELLDASSEQERRRAWALLLYAVGNIKRSAANLHPPAFVEQAPALADRSPSFPCPTRTGEIQVDRDSLETWRRMEKETHGLGVATSTTVLAALWPHHHAILDRYTLWGVAALRCISGEVENEVDPDATDGGGLPTWSRYGSWRDSMLTTASRLDVRLWELERAIWLEYKALEPTGKTWRETGQLLLARLR